MAVGGGRQVDEGIVQTVNVLEQMPQGFYAERLREVVAAEDQIDAQFMGHGDVPVGTLPGHVGTAAEGCGLDKVVPGSSGADEDVASRGIRGIRPESLNGRSEDGFQPLRQLPARAGEFPVRTQGNAVVVQSFIGTWPDSAGLRQQGVISVHGVDVQRKVGGVNRQVPVHGGFQLPVCNAGNGLHGLPENAVMKEEQVRPRL